ncbi:MAG TPA: DUF2188 domain-containing protein [Thermoanaerobaculia bacterium]|jgi:hypothetical protein|nr:DUF2188 domain-containing protein [Thermoanaerobaculia bacterium]
MPLQVNGGRMAGRSSYHVVTHPEGGWAVVKSGSGRASRRFDTQGDAIAWAREASRNQRTDLIVHGRDGTVRRWDSYGAAPLAPRDRR